MIILQDLCTTPFRSYPLWYPQIINFYVHHVMRCMGVYRGWALHYGTVPDGVFVHALFQIINDHFVFPRSEVSGHRPLDLCPVLVDDH